MNGPVANASLKAYRQAVAEYAAAEVEVKRCADARAAALWVLARSGWSLARIADAAGVTRARVSQLIDRARAMADAPD